MQNHPVKKQMIQAINDLIGFKKAALESFKTIKESLEKIYRNLVAINLIIQILKDKKIITDEEFENEKRKLTEGQGHSVDSSGSEVQSEGAGDTPSGS